MIWSSAKNGRQACGIAARAPWSPGRVPLVGRHALRRVPARRRIDQRPDLGEFPRAAHPSSPPLPHTPPHPWQPTHAAIAHRTPRCPSTGGWSRGPSSSGAASGQGVESPHGRAGGGDDEEVTHPPTPGRRGARAGRRRRLDTSHRRRAAGRRPTLPRDVERSTAVGRTLETGPSRQRRRSGDTPTTVIEGSAARIEAATTARPRSCRAGPAGDEGGLAACTSRPRQRGRLRRPTRRTVLAERVGAGAS